VAVSLATSCKVLSFELPSSAPTSEAPLSSLLLSDEAWSAELVSAVSRLELPPLVLQ
jgi:hypothetical protein